MRRVLRSKRQLAASTHFDEKAPPTDRGELHVGGVAVLTRPFSGCTGLNTVNSEKFRILKKCLRNWLDTGFVRPSLKRHAGKQRSPFSPVPQRERVDLSQSRPIISRNQHGYGCRLSKV